MIFVANWVVEAGLTCITMQPTLCTHQKEKKIALKIRD